MCDGASLCAHQMHVQKSSVSLGRTQQYACQRASFHQLLFMTSLRCFSTCHTCVSRISVQYPQIVITPPAVSTQRRDGAAHLAEEVCYSVFLVALFFVTKKEGASGKKLPSYIVVAIWERLFIRERTPWL